MVVDVLVETSEVLVVVDVEVSLEVVVDVLVEASGVVVVATDVLVEVSEVLVVVDVLVEDPSVLVEVVVDVLVEASEVLVVVDVEVPSGVVVDVLVEASGVLVVVDVEELPGVVVDVLVEIPSAVVVVDVEVPLVLVVALQLPVFPVFTTTCFAFLMFKGLKEILLNGASIDPRAVRQVNPTPAICTKSVTSFTTCPIVQTAPTPLATTSKNCRLRDTPGKASTAVVNS